MSLWTLVCDGTEKTLEDWGIKNDFERERASKEKGVFRCRTTEGFDAGGPQFAYRNKVTVWRDRMAVGSGGTIYFQGYWDDGRQVVEEGRQFIEYVAFDVWWLFERQIFMQTLRQFSQTEGHVPTGTFLYDWKLSPEVFLGELLTDMGSGNAALSLQTNGEQIIEIVNWLNECYNATKQGATSGRDNSQDVVQVGTIDVQSQQAVERASGIYCSEAITRVLRLHPDSIVAMDLTTVPPTLNVRTFAKWNYSSSPPTFVDYTNLEEVTITLPKSACVKWRTRFR